MQKLKSGLSVVADTSAPPAPYPADTKSKGWHFEIDHEAIEQSDTWTLAGTSEAGPEMRPWLLMIWYTAWKQIPCGSLPSDPALIAARIGMPSRQFSAHKDLLLRGWWLAADGRMYHKTITKQVLALIGFRESEAARKAEYRARKEAERLAKQGLSSECPTGQTRDGRGIPPSATTPLPLPLPLPLPNIPTTDVVGSATSAPPPARQARKKATTEKPDDVQQGVWDDFLALRKSKGAPLTQTALDGIAAEAQKAGLSLAEALTECCARGWQGFKAEWVQRDPVAQLQASGFRPSRQPAHFNKQEALEASNRRVAEEFLKEMGFKHDGK